MKVYQGTMDYYYDHEKFLCLKNTKKRFVYGNIKLIIYNS